MNGYVGRWFDAACSEYSSRVSYVLSNSAYALDSHCVERPAPDFRTEVPYISPDGNFVFGGSPLGWDFFVGVRTGARHAEFSGLYYQAGIDEPVDSSGIGYLDSYYGSLNDSGGAIVGHQRVGMFGSSAYRLQLRRHVFAERAEHTATPVHALRGGIRRRGADRIRDRPRTWGCTWRWPRPRSAARVCT